MLTYFCKRKSDARIVGIVNIRLALNDFLRTEFGHIGSARTILNCGAPLNAEFVSRYFGETIQQYIISKK